jgi:hypothetical protein
VNNEAVKWALLGTDALIPPAMFVTAAFGALTPLAFLAMPLLFIELIVAIIFVAATLTSQRRDRSGASGGQLPPRPGAGRPRREGRTRRHQRWPGSSRRPRRPDPRRIAS